MKEKPQLTEWVAGRYVKALLSTHFGQEHGPTILRKVQIDSKALSDPSGRVTTEQYSRLLRHLLISTRDESFGFTAQRIKPGTFAMMCQLIIHSGQLEQALKNCARFYGLLTDDFRLHIVRTSEVACIELHVSKELAGSASFFTESVFAILLRLSSWLIDKPIRPQQIQFAFPRELSGRSFDAKFPGAVSYDQSCSSLVIPLAYLKEDIKHDSIELRDLLAKGSHRFLIDFKKDDSYTTRIASFLIQDTEHLNQSLEGFAGQFGLSPSSLRRKLREEGQNFHDLRESIRKQRSLYYLHHTHKSIDAIAAATGYSESSTFHRAFKKWTGLTPQAYRQKAPVRRTTDSQVEQ